MTAHATKPEHLRDSVDYAATYDAYWRREDRWGQHSFADASDLARNITLLAGAGSVLDVGTGMGGLVFALLKEGIDAHGVDVAPVAVERGNARAPGRFSQGSILALPFADASVDTVVCTDVLEHLAPHDVERALHELARVARKNIYIAVSTVPDRDGSWHLTIQPREWWERQCFAAGLRTHPRAMRVLPYAQKEHEGSSVTILLEKISESARDAWPLASLDAESQLHNDMLRVAGRRADAHVARYHFACEFVRPNDRILDVSSGLGYGAHILAHNSTASHVQGIDIDARTIAYATDNYASPRVTFTTGDAQRLASLPDNSIDLVASFETLEHVPDPIAALREFHRVLTPGGRVIASVPNDWTDESGRDPNPHHLHVYTWSKLLEHVRASGGDWIIERASRQTAGGGMKLANQPRAIDRVPLDEHGNVSTDTTEWWLITLMKSPLSGRKSDYRETVFPAPSLADDAHYHLTSFARDYDNPWLVRSMIAMGMRVSDDAQLTALARRVIESARIGSADHGAAICVLLYAAINDKPLAGLTVDDLILARDRFLQRCDTTPHAQRWAISNAYAVALLLQSRGDLRRAREAFTVCAYSDPLVFSPLLATKTIDAAWRSGLLAMHAGNTDDATDHWTHGLRESRRVVKSTWLNIVGEESSPQPFALSELTQVIDAANRCARSLAFAPHWQHNPALALELSQQSPLADARAAWREAQRLANAWQAQLNHNRTIASERDAGWNEARRITSEWEQAVAAATTVRESADARLREAQLSLESSMARERAAMQREAALLADRDLWLAESKRLEREWSQQSARIQELVTKVDSLFAEVRATAADRDNWQREARRIAGEWEAAAEQLHQLRAHNDHLAAFAHDVERQRDDAARRVTELVATTDSQQREINTLLAQLRDAGMSVAHHRGLYEAIRAEADALERRRTFRVARAAGLLDPIYTGKTAPTIPHATPTPPPGTTA
ncbi:MAG TPA: methyltransferase domain-containing protein [Phycisphaerales bacterium]|nr:methyltransferase domain-containing protein [Phycisphaerales bacterium]